MWTLFAESLIVGFGVMLGLELALGLCIAIGTLIKESGENE